jgi:hypothetical protein
MNYRVLFSVAAAAAIAFAQPVAYLAQEANKAADIIAAARKAIGGGTLDAMKTFSVQSTVDRNMGSMQMSSDVEIVLDFPDKYLRAETMNGGGMMVTTVGGGVTGFNGDKPLQNLRAAGMSATGGMVIRMGGGGPMPAGEKLTDEQVETLSKQVVRSSRTEISRLMLGWFANAHPAANAQYVYLGEAESVEGKAWVVEVKNTDNLAARLFVDQQTSLPLMVTYQGPQPRVVTQSMGAPPAAGGGHTVTTQRPAGPLNDEERKKLQADVEKQIQDAQKQAPAMVDYALYFEEWRDAEGIKFPHKIRRAISGTTTEEWTIRKIKVNPRVDPKRFAGES